jgi:nicotinate-nucleotide pyrophosphorylase (carboxylating)
VSVAADLYPPPRSSWLALVDAALAEDVGGGDATTLALVAAGAAGRAYIEAREPQVASGLGLAAEVFERCGASLVPDVRDGDQLDPGGVLGTVTGPARAILTAERTALNFLQHLGGIATLTSHFCQAVRDTGARIVDTRKTTPGWRALEKYAVRCGGGTNHRFGLYDGVLIKDNHIAALGSVGAAVKRARENAPAGLRIQVEVESVAQAQEALEAGAELLLVDNQPPAVLAEVVRLVGGRVPIEASGGVNLETVAEIARTGVDRISIGALTHSARAVDIGLEWNERSSS